MKYIKKFEIAKITRYWKVPTGPKFKIALKKIGMNPNDIDNWYPLFEHDKKDIFMINSNGWSWATIDNMVVKPKYKFMGEVEVEGWEVDAEKYNL